MSDETKTAEQLAAEVKAAFDGALKDVRTIAEEAMKEVKANGELTTKTKETADAALIKMNTLGEQVAQLEQRVAKGVGGGPEETKTWGQIFTEDEKVKAFLQQAQPRGRIDIVRKAILLSGTGATAGSVGDAIRPTRLPDILALPQRQLTIRDLLTPGQMGGNTLEYVVETGFTNSAAPIAEAAAKPMSDITLDLKSTSARVIAHYMKASRQVMDDIPQLQSIIDQRLMYGLKFVEENQILNGDGTGQNLLGIIPQATAYAAPIAVPTPTKIDTLRLAQLQAALALFPATGHVLNPADWAAIELTKDAAGNYVVGDPQGVLGATLWGLPVVQTQAMAVTKFLTGAFRLGAQLFDRWAARIEIATENEDDFIKNLITVLCEERLALAVYRPQAFIYGTLP